jgi:hypothetical protein
MEEYKYFSLSSPIATHSIIATYPMTKTHREHSQLLLSLLFDSFESFGGALREWKGKSNPSFEHSFIIKPLDSHLLLLGLSP